LETNDEYENMRIFVIKFIVIIAKTTVPAMHHTQISAIIPAAGSSVRMGRDKALLTAAGGVTFVDLLVDCFVAWGCNPVVLVVNEQFDQHNCHTGEQIIVTNHHPERGRAWSIFLGLQQVPAGAACFIQNVDNPFIEPALLDNLLNAVTPNSYAVPVFQGRGGHPLLLGPGVVGHLRHNTGSSDFRRQLQVLNRISVPYQDGRILWNINTPADYEEFMRGKPESAKML
jgi:CTP:molybdopterin cytidylyltransferase MocA